MRNKLIPKVEILWTEFCNRSSVISNSKYIYHCLIIKCCLYLFLSAISVVVEMWWSDNRNGPTTLSSHFCIYLTRNSDRWSVGRNGMFATCEKTFLKSRPKISHKPGKSLVSRFCDWNDRRKCEIRKRWAVRHLLSLPDPALISYDFSDTGTILEVDDVCTKIERLWLGWVSEVFHNAVCVAEILLLRTRVQNKKM